MIDVRFVRLLAVVALMVLHLATSFVVSYSAESPRESERLTSPSTVSSAATRGDLPSWSENQGERLYNGIVLPKVWPPKTMDPASTEPMPVPYLDHPPSVIAIDVGRQLFVDGFLVQETDLVRVFHRPTKYAGNPVFKAAAADEIARNATVYLGHGGVFFDPDEQLFKMFYTAGWRGGLAMATSRNMVHWTRPELDIVGGNLLLPPGARWTGTELKTAGTDNCVWYDLNAKDPGQRIKFMTCWGHVPVDQRPKGFEHTLQVSDGRQWSDTVPTGMAQDYCSFFFNPFRQKWVYSIKQGGPRGRSRHYSENSDFLQGADWSESVYWTNADRLDLPEPEGRYPESGSPPQLYSLNAVAYESLLIGMHNIHRGPNNGICAKGNFPKLVDLELGFSRDGFHWHRPDCRGFLVGEREEGKWDRAYLHSTAGVCSLVDDKLVFPYVGTSGIAPDGRRGMYTGLSVGLAMLRRDGFASMDAESETGTLTTRPVVFSGKCLFVNVDAPKGTLRVEVLGEDGRPIEPFTMKNCDPLTTNSTLEQVTWKGGSDLSKLQRRPVRFRFHLGNGSLYSFWVSRDESGRSDGYVAAGGPGYTSLTDSIGRAALEAAERALEPAAEAKP